MTTNEHNLCELQHREILGWRVWNACLRMPVTETSQASAARHVAAGRGCRPLPCTGCQKSSSLMSMPRLANWKYGMSRESSCLGYKGKSHSYQSPLWRWCRSQWMSSDQLVVKVHIQKCLESSPLLTECHRTVTLFTSKVLGWQRTGLKTQHAPAWEWQQGSWEECQVSTSSPFSSTELGPIHAPQLTQCGWLCLPMPTTHRPLSSPGSHCQSHRESSLPTTATAWSLAEVAEHVEPGIWS